MTVRCAERPPAYTLSDEPQVELRPLERGDTAAVLEIFAGMGTRSRELRFLTPKPRLTAADLHQLTEVDQHDHVAILALSDGRPIAIGRFVRDPQHPQSADVAMAVVDASQNRGIATLLTSALLQRAREVDVRRLTLMMAHDNQGALRLLQRAPGEIEPLGIDGGVVEVALTVPETGFVDTSADGV